MSVILNPNEIKELKTEIIFDGGNIELSTVKLNDGPITVRYTSANGSASNYFEKIRGDLPETFNYKGETYGRGCMGVYGAENNGIVAKYYPQYLWCKGSSGKTIEEMPEISEAVRKASGFEKNL